MLFATVGLQHATSQNFTSGGLNYSVTSATTVEVAINVTATGIITIPSEVT